MGKKFIRFLNNGFDQLEDGFNLLSFGFVPKKYQSNYVQINFSKSKYPRTAQEAFKKDLKKISADASNAFKTINESPR